MNLNITERLQQALSATLRNIQELNKENIKVVAAAMQQVYSTMNNYYKAIYISNLYVNHIVEYEKKEIGVIVQQEQDIDSIISLLLFKDICSKHNKEIKHIMQVSYKGKATLITKGSAEKLSDIQFFALDCEYRDKRMNVISIHNHLNDEKFSKNNIAPYAFIYKDKLQTNPYIYTSKEFINSKQYGGNGVRRGFATAMILMSENTPKKYHSFILAADTCSYAIVVDNYSKDNGFRYANVLLNELESLQLNTTNYKAHKSYSRELKKSIELTQAAEKGAFIFETYKELTEEQAEVIAEYAAIIEQDYVSYEEIKNNTFMLYKEQTMEQILNKIAAIACADIELINLALSDYDNKVFAKYTYRELQA